MAAQCLGQRVAHALLMRAALLRRDGVAVGADEGVDLRRPGHRPFDRAAKILLTTVLVLGATEELALGHRVARTDFTLEEVEQAAREFENLLGRRIALDQRRIA